MLAVIQFEFPLGWQAGLPLALAALGLAFWRQRQHGVGSSRAGLLTLFRSLALLPLVFLAARPVWLAKEPPPPGAARPVVLLMDRSESMSLEENEATRYQQALRFARDFLLPALKSAGLPVQARLFAEQTEPVDGPGLASARPDGKRAHPGRGLGVRGRQDPGPAAGGDCANGRRCQRKRRQRPRSFLAARGAHPLCRSGLRQRSWRAHALLAPGRCP